MKGGSKDVASNGGACCPFVVLEKIIVASLQGRHKVEIGYAKEPAVSRVSMTGCGWYWLKRLSHNSNEVAGPARVAAR